MDTSGHPDLIRLGRSLRDRMDRTLEAEMEAARSAARRLRSLRDVLLAAEDRGDTVRISGVDGALHTGSVEAVGADHVELAHDASRRIVALCHIVSVEVVP